VCRLFVVHFFAPEKYCKNPTLDAHRIGVVWITLCVAQKKISAGEEGENGVISSLCAKDMKNGVQNFF
jgi:hypothetical protein